MYKNTSISSFRPEHYEQVADYVRQHDTIAGVESLLNNKKITLNSIYRRCNENDTSYDPIFGRMIDAARLDYKALNTKPSADPELRHDVKTSMKELAKTGYVTITYDIDDEGNEIPRRKVVKRGVPSWVYLAAYPDDVLQIDAVRHVVASQTAFLVRHWSAEHYTIISDFLRAFLFENIDIAEDTGQKVPKSLKDLKPTVTIDNLFESPAIEVDGLYHEDMADDGGDDD